MTVHGTCDPRFAELRRILDESLESGDDLGASVALTIGGESLIDM